MNWKIILLMLLTLQHGFRLILNVVQYTSAGNPTPANVADVYDGDTYQRWKRYSAEKSRLRILSTVVSYVLMLALLGLNVHAAVAALFPAGVFWQLLAVLLFQSLAEALTSLGIDYVDTMVIEQKYGFNRSTGKTFAADQLRNLLMNLVLELILVGLLALLHRTMGDWMVVLFTAAVFGILMIIVFLAPLISRLGNKFVPLEDGELKQRLQALLVKHGYRVKAIEVMDASRRTTKMNAYFTGFGKMKTIVLYDTLVAGMTPDEICAVFSHELGHGLHKDTIKMQAMNLINLMLLAVTAWLVVRDPGMHLAFGFAEVNYGFANILIPVILGLVQPLTGMLTSAYSRHAEYRADRQAVAEGYGSALATALKKLSRENFAHLAPSRLLVLLEYSHPPLSDRLAALENEIGE